MAQKTDLSEYQAALDTVGFVNGWSAGSPTLSPMTKDEIEIVHPDYSVMLISPKSITLSKTQRQSLINFVVRAPGMIGELMAKIRLLETQINPQQPLASPPVAMPPQEQPVPGPQVPPKK